MAFGLLEVAIAFAAISFGGYLTIHELKEKDVKKIQKKRLQATRGHLSELAKQCTESGQVTQEIEDKFLDLSRNEYAEAYEPTRILNFIDRSLLFSGVLFLTTILIDWTNDNSISFGLQDLQLFPIEIELFFLGVFLLAIGLFNLERLRRMTEDESDLDPPPFDVILFIGLFLTIDLYFLWLTTSNYATLTLFGKGLFYSSLPPFIGAILAVTAWEKGGWKRTLGMLLLLSPFFFILGWFILSMFHL